MNFKIEFSKTFLSGYIDSYSIFTILQFLSKLQTFSIPLYIQSEYIEDKSFQPIAVINSFSRGLMLNIRDDYFQSQFYHLALAYSGVCFFIFALIIFLSYFGFTKRNPLTKLWNLICLFHVYFGCYPVFAVLLRQAVDYLTPHAEGILAQDLDNQGYTILSLILIIWNLGFLCIYLYFVTPGIKVKGFFSTKNHIPFSLEVGEKVLLLFIIFVSREKDNKLAMVYLNFIISGIRIYLALKWIPYWSIVAHRQEVLTYGPNFVLCGLNLFGSWIESSLSRKYFLLWIVLIPIATKISFSIMREVMLSSLAYTKNTSKWAIVGRKHIISYLTTKKLIKRKSLVTDHDFLLYSSGISSQWKEIPITPRSEADYYLFEYENLAQKNRRFKPYLLTFFNLVLKYEPSNLKIYDFFKSTESSDKDFRVQVAVSYFKDKLREKMNLESQSHLNSCNLDINKYIKLRNLMKSLKHEIVEQLNYQIKFWGDYSSHEVEFSKLWSYSQAIEKKKRQINQIWAQFDSQELKQYHTPSILYSIYLSHVNNQPVTSLKFTKNSRFKRHDETDILSNDSLYQDNTISIFISGQKTTLGHITDISKSCEQLLGYVKRDVLGLNIKNVQPSFFSCRHDRKLSNYFTTGKRSILNVLLYLYVKDAEGYIRPAEVIAAQNPFFENDLKF